MPNSLLVINADGPEYRVALVENGLLGELYIERKQERGIAGNIYKGRVERVLPGMQAAFVNIGQIAKMAQQMQAQMAQAQQELAETTLEATAGGGAVRLVITGAQEVRSVEIDPSAVDPAEVEMLQDLVMTAVNEAISRSKELERERMGKIAGGMGIPGMPGLPGIG